MQQPHKMPLLTSEEMSELPTDARTDSIVDRKWCEDKDNWEYQTLQRDGTLSEWTSQATMLRSFHVQALDSFHALYELRYEHQMPKRARRRTAEPGKRLSVADAEKKFPKGTLIAKPGDDGAGEQDYVKGEVQGYLAPWWRVAYSDESWEDLAAT